MTLPECEALAPLLSALIDDELADGERARVEAHLRSCRPCRDRVSEYRAIGRLVAGLTAAEPPPSLVRGFRARLSAERPDDPERPGRDWTLAAEDAGHR